MTDRKLRSWGRYPNHPQSATRLDWRNGITPALTQATKTGPPTLAFGMGRSYGDSCLAASDRVLHTIGLDRVIAADWDRGIIRAEAGLSLEQLIHIALPRGWFLPVTPGTKYVTLGGAVANDVHGKNHHLQGTFGCHVKRIGLIRSDRGVAECAPKQDEGLFRATIGGLGLTGIMAWVEIQLLPVTSSLIDVISIRYENLDEFFSLAQSHDAQHEYSVAWIDCVSHGKGLGRGIYMCGDHAPDGTLSEAKRRKLRVPVTPPVSMVNPISLRAFNFLYYHRQRVKQHRSRVDYDGYFYPLDGILEWNRIYGPAGFQQYQCVVPEACAHDAIAATLDAIARSGSGSFLSVMKRFGEVPSPGLLSFPMPGTTLALDFPQRDAENARLFGRLDAIVREAGGRLYPAKDAHMTKQDFQAAYPAWEQLASHRDPALMSRFWQRVSGP